MWFFFNFWQNIGIKNIPFFWPCFSIFLALATWFWPVLIFSCACYFLQILENIHFHKSLIMNTNFHIIFFTAFHCSISICYLQNVAWKLFPVDSMRSSYVLCLPGTKECAMCQVPPTFLALLAWAWAMCWASDRKCTTEKIYFRNMGKHLIALPYLN